MKTSLRRFSKGQAIAEFALILPALFLLVLASVEVALTGVRSVVATHSAMRAARVAEVHQPVYAETELYAMLTPSLFTGGFVEPDADVSQMKIVAVANPLVHVTSLWEAWTLTRKSPQGHALPGGMSDEVLREGDTPSPYCAGGQEGYTACGYPE